MVLNTVCPWVYVCDILSFPQAILWVDWRAEDFFLLLTASLYEHMQGVIIVVQDNITFIQRWPCIIQAGYLEAVMLSGDNEGF